LQGKACEPIITAKLKLITTKEQFAALRETQLAYREALNAVSRSAFEQGKTSSVTRLHKGMYAQLRARYGLPSQLACSVERQVAATYKGLWTKLKKNAEHRRAKITKKRFKGLDQPPHYRSPTVQYTYERDYTFQCDSRVSVGTLNGRISLPYQGYDQHIALIRQGGTIGDAKLWYDSPKKRFYLLVSLTIDLPDPTPAQLTDVVGVDVGIRYLAVTSTAKGKATFHPGKQTRHKANHYARLRKRLRAVRHSWRETSGETHRATRETVQSASQSHPRQTDRWAPSTRASWTGTPHRYSRAYHTPETTTQEERQRLRASLPKGPQSQSRVFAMVLCRVTCAHQLQGCAFRVTGCQGGCRLHLKAVPDVWAYCRCESPAQRAALCVSEPGVPLHAAC
jgi:predicted transposase